VRAYPWYLSPISSSPGTCVGGGWMVASSSLRPRAPECPDVKNYNWRLNTVWNRMLYSCTHIIRVVVKGLIWSCDDDGVRRSLWTGRCMKCPEWCRVVSATCWASPLTGVRRALRGSRIERVAGEPSSRSWESWRDHRLDVISRPVRSVSRSTLRTNCWRWPKHSEVPWWDCLRRSGRVSE